MKLDPSDKRQLLQFEPEANLSLLVSTNIQNPSNQTDKLFGTSAFGFGDVIFNFMQFTSFIKRRWGQSHKNYRLTIRTHCHRSGCSLLFKQKQLLAPALKQGLKSCS
jgi:hypothetical protein